MWTVAVVSTGSHTRKFSKWKLFVVFLCGKFLIVSLRSATIAVLSPIFSGSMG